MKVKAKKPKAEGSRQKGKGVLSPAFSLQLSALLLIVFLCRMGWAQTEIPKLTPAVQRVVYKAQQLIKKKEYSKAEIYIKSHIKKHPHYLVEFTMGNALALMGKEREALSYYKASANHYGGYTPTWQNMGKIYFDLKQYERAGDCLLKAYQTNKKKDPSSLYNAAVAYIMAGKGKKALPHLEYLSSGKAGTPKTEWLEALLKVCMELKLEGKAYKVIYKLLDKDESDPRWWKILTQFYLQQGDYKSAAVALTVYSYLTPLKNRETMLLGDLYNFIGIPLKAAAYYEKALTWKNNAAVYEKLATAYIAAHKPKRAIDTLERALKKKPTSKLWFMMGRVLYDETNFDKAYDAFAQSARLDPKNGRAYLMMGYCALQIDKNDAARSAFQKAFRFPGQRKMAEKLLGHVRVVSRH